jgi:hypothetical protein
VETEQPNATSAAVAGKSAVTATARAPSDASCVKVREKSTTTEFCAADHPSKEESASQLYQGGSIWNSGGIRATGIIDVIGKSTLSASGDMVRLSKKLPCSNDFNSTTS